MVIGQSQNKIYIFRSILAHWGVKIYKGAIFTFILLVLFAIPFASAKDTIELKYTFEKPILGSFENYTTVRLPNAGTYQAPGEPVLPMKTIQVLIPANTEINKIDIKTKIEVLLGNYLVEPGQQPYALCCNEIPPFTPPKETIYSSYTSFPKNLHEKVTTQQIRGYEILIINLFPVKYIPKSGELTYYKELTVEVSLKEAKKTHKLLRSLNKDKLEVEKKVDNPEDTRSYDTLPQEFTISSFVDPLDSYDYVIITNDALKNAAGAYTLQDLAAFRESKGLTTIIVTTEEILAEPDYYCDGPFGDGCISTFNDTQARIRNFIKDAYQNWETEYVLLAGDGDGDDVGYESGDNIIPARKLIGYKGELIPADMYYSNLDGNFDNDGDTVFGETIDGVGGTYVDLFSEVYIGRAPLDRDQEVSNFVRKTLAYETSAGSYLDKAWMVGEHLGFGGIADYAGAMKDEVKDGSDAHGYTTVGFPEEFNVSTLYDRDWPTFDWPKEELISIMNSNVHIINHLGHASTCYVMKLCNSPYDDGGPCPVDGVRYGKATDVDDLTNDEFLFAYSQGCFPGSFDNWNYEDIYTTCDSIAEHFVTSEHGAFAMIANSRSGWGMGYSTDGPSQRFDRQFWDAVFGEEITVISKANADSKEDNAGSIGDTIIRYCYYTINLFGDPAVDFKMKKIDITIATDKNIYDPGETILVTGTVDGDSGPINADLEIYFYDPQNNQLDHVTTTSPGGTYSTSFTISSDSEPGDYEIRVDATYANMTASKTKKVKVGSLTIDLSPTQLVIPYNTTHTIEGYVYDDAVPLENANITAYAIIHGLIEENLSTITDINGYFSTQWLPDDYGAYDIVVFAKDTITNKAGKEEIEVYSTPPAPGTLRVYLRDAQNNYIYESTCPFQAEKWHDIRITIYDESQIIVESQTSPSCQEGFNLTPGTYRLVITGSTTFEQDPYTFIDQEVVISTGSYLDVDLSGDGKLHTILKNPIGDYMYDAYSKGCPYPAEDWYDIQTSLYQNGTRKIFTTHSRCLEGYYLIPGTYTVKIEGKLTSSHPLSTLLEKEITINAGDVINLTTEDLSMLNIMLKDTEGLYIRDQYGSCSHASNSWYNIGILVFNESGAQIIDSYNADCEEAYYLPPANYSIKINGRASSNQDGYVLVEKNIELVKGHSTNITLESLAKVNIILIDSEGNYIRDQYATCPYASDSWYNIYTRFYNSTEASVIYSFNSGCFETYYLKQGSYRVEIKGRATSDQDDFTLVDKSIELEEGEVRNISLQDTGKLIVTLLDSSGEYLRDQYATCPYTSASWYNIITYVYNSSGGEVIYSFNSGCQETYYLNPGIYTVFIAGRANSDQDQYTMLTEEIEITGGMTTSVTLESIPILKVILKDAENNYLRDQYAACPYGSTSWYNLLTYVYNETGQPVIYSFNSGCEEKYFAKPGNYEVRIAGRPNSDQDDYTLLTKPIELFEGQKKTITLEDLAILKVWLKDANEVYIRDQYATCGITNLAWYNILTKIYNTSAQIINSFNSGCTEQYYMKSGSYKVTSSGRVDGNQADLPLIEKTVQLGQGEVSTLITTDMAMIGVIVKDNSGNYLHGQYSEACTDTPNKAYYSLTLQLYNTSSLIQTSNQIGCFTTIGVKEGTYNITILSKELSGSPQETVSKERFFQEGEICIMTINKDTNSVIYNCRNPQNRMVMGLEAGWNLISIPFEGNQLISTVFSGLDYSDIFAYNGEWYMPTTINNSVGVWLNLNSNGTLDVSGFKPNHTEIPLQEGWNLIGYPKYSHMLPENVFNSINHSICACYDDTWMTHIDNKPTNSLPTIGPGFGVWVKSNEDTTLIFDELS